ncbi:MAG: hypothetical protein JW808_11550 [Victivallales bacterium]|nr:hypothetical protein [Victivallales bacterium]
MGIPGYIDLQVNGLKGVDYTGEDLSVDSFVFSCEQLRSNGTVGFLPTVVTSPPEQAEMNLRTMVSAMKYREVAEMVAGFHLEGPFISGEEGARGVHPAERVLGRADLDWLSRMREAGDDMIKLITLAAELPGAEGFIKAARDCGILVSLGHQLADGVHIGRAVKAGAVALTHLGNGLPSFIHRFNNPLWPSLADDSLMAMFIPDGHHIPPDLIKVILRVKGIENLTAVSDASTLALMPPGDYEAFGRQVKVDGNGKISDPNTGYLAGSWSTLGQCVDYLRTLEFLDEAMIEHLVFFNPLEFLKRGKIKSKLPFYTLFADTTGS